MGGGGCVYKCVTVCACMCMYTWGQPICEDLHVSKLYIQTIDIFGQRGSEDLDISYFELSIATMATGTQLSPRLHDIMYVIHNYVIGKILCVCVCVCDWVCVWGVVLTSCTHGGSRSSFNVASSLGHPMDGHA